MSRLRTFFSRRESAPLVGAALASALMLTLACGGGGGQSSATPTPTAAPTPTPTPLPTIPVPSASLSSDERANVLVAAMTQDEKLKLVHGLQHDIGGLPRGAVGYISGIQRMSFPDLYLVDGSTGVGNSVGESTGLPSCMASAAAWDLDLAYEYGKVLGKDMRAHGVNINLGGNVNLSGREPRGGRVFEMKGEDPILAGRINAAHIKAIQDQNILACIKHFAFNDQETNRGDVNAIIEERAGRETDLLAFEIGVKDSNVQSVMAGYNVFNGTWCSENDSLLNGVLKGTWNFKGFVMTDWWGAHSGVKAATAGLDMEMPGFDNFGSLGTAISGGQMPQARLDDMVHRIVRGVFEVGLFEHPVSVGSVDATANLAVAQTIAEQGTVLLKNGGKLPLSPQVNSIAIIGPHADVAVLSGGGSATVIPIGGAVVQESNSQVNWTSATWYPSSPKNTIKAKAPSATVTFNDGSNATQAAAVAKAADIAIVFAAQWSSEAMDRATLNLTDYMHSLDQDALISAVAAANPNTIVVLEGPGAQAMPWLSSVNSVLAAWYPGQRGAEAIANILFGDVNPSGKLPITFPKTHLDLPRTTISGSEARYDEGLKTGYKWFDAQSIDPLFPFGFGLSYTTFTLSNTSVALNQHSLTVTLDVKNTGTRAGAEVVQVYLSLPSGLNEPPHRLIGWQKVQLAAGETKTIKLVIDGDSSAHPFGTWDLNAKAWTIANGDYTVWVGNSSRSLTSAGTITF